MRISIFPFRKRRRSRGMAVIEMMVSLLVLFYLVMGGVEFGWFMYAKHTMQSAARDGARRGIIGGTTTAQVNTAISATMTASNFGSIGYTTQYQEVTSSSTGVVTYATTSDIQTVDTGNGLRVTISAPFSAFGIRPLGIIPATKVISGVATMIKE